MVAQQDTSRVRSESDRVRSDEEIAKTVSLVVQGLLPQLQRSQYPEGRRETVDESKKAKLDEKCFRRIDKFVGDPTQFRMWSFNLRVALGQVD
eukprot:8494914-Karenia_brevis.AAC.1